MDVSLSQDLWDEELALIVAASKDPVVVHETYLPPNMAEGQAKRWFFGQKWAFFTLLDEKPVGMTVFHPKPAKAGTVEVDAWVLEEFRGLGISQKAFPLVVEEARKRWDTLLAWVWDTNTASLGLSGAVGFAPTGRTYEMEGRTCREVRFDLA